MAVEREVILKTGLAFLAIISLTGAVSAETFGDQQNQAIPNVTELSIYDVTGLSQQEQRTQGTLVDEGLNKTFPLTEREYRQYRFEFNVTNDGSGNWTLQPEDSLQHSGLNTSWNVEEIFYNISEARFGGNFTSGTVKWNTTEGGTLDENGVNSSMEASYVVNISFDSSQVYDQEFLVNDTSNNSGSLDTHDLDITRPGILNTTLIRPPNNTVLQRNNSFNMTGQIECLDGECGQVNLSARYNETGGPAETVIPESSGTPFYATESNLTTCNYLLSGEICRRNISVNATGDIGSDHLLDVESFSNISKVQDNQSDDHEVTIKSVIIMDLSWDTISFGALDPGRENVSAQGNTDSAYNITITENSRIVDGLWVNASNLTSEVDPNYAIRPGNITQGFDKDPAGGTQLDYGFQNIMNDILPGTVIPTYYHLDVPFGLTQGDYTGSITFKANRTS